MGQTCSTRKSTLVELVLPFPVITNPKCGFRVACFLHLKRLTLHAIDEPDSVTRDGLLLDFGTTFPALQCLSMNTSNLHEYGGEELGNALQISSTACGLKRLTLATSPHLKVLASTVPIKFSHVDSLALHSHMLKEEHLQLLASIQWPSLTSISYKSDNIYPRSVPRLLDHAPKLRWLTVSIGPAKEFVSDLPKMVSRAVWPNLRSVCIEHECKKWMFPKQVPIMQRACPNATIHLKPKSKTRAIRGSFMVSNSLHSVVGHATSVLVNNNIHCRHLVYVILVSQFR
jgi:hypothetical protein